MANNWLLLRGLARGRGHWGSFVETLQERFPEDHFELLDLPGNGERCAESSPLSIREYVEDLRARCSYLKQNQEFQILALSLGAMIATDWMHAYPFEIKKSYLVCTSSAAHSHFYQRFQVQNLFKGAPLLISQGQPEKWEHTILDMITNNPQRRGEELERLVAYSKANPVRPQNILRQLWAASTYRFPEGAPGEVRLIGSHGDQLVSPECTLNLARSWKLEPRMHLTSGHDIPIDDPHWLIEQLL